MYYESPALLNLTVCENALNLERTEEDEKPKKRVREWGRTKKGKLHNSALSAEGPG